MHFPLGKDLECHPFRVCAYLHISATIISSLRDFRLFDRLSEDCSIFQSTMSWRARSVTISLRRFVRELSRVAATVFPLPIALCLLLCFFPLRVPRFFHLHNSWFCLPIATCPLPTSSYFHLHWSIVTLIHCYINLLLH